MRPLPARPPGRRAGLREREMIRRALDLMAALKLGMRISLDDSGADEFQAMLIIAEERDLLEREKLPGSGGRRSR